MADSGHTADNRAAKIVAVLDQLSDDAWEAYRKDGSRYNEGWADAMERAYAVAREGLARD